MFLKLVDKGRNDWWIFLLTIILIPVGYITFQLPLLGILAYAEKKFEDVDESTYLKFEETPDFSLFHLDKNVGLIFMILMFLGVWLVLLLSLKILHKRHFKTLITPKSQIDLSKIFFSFFLFLSLSLMNDGFNYLLHPESYSFQFEIEKFIPLLLIGIFILPIQTTAEELLFRGYLLQGFYYFFKSPWLSVLITSILFGLVHADNPEIEKYGVFPMQTYYIGAGVFLALLTIFDDSLELAIGIHAAINFYAAVVSSYSGSVLQTDSLLKSSEMNPWISNFVLITAFFLFIFIAGRKYHWPKIGELLSRLDTITTNNRNL